MSFSVTPNPCQQSQQGPLAPGLPCGVGREAGQPSCFTGFGGQVSHSRRVKVAGPGQGLESTLQDWRFGAGALGSLHPPPRFLGRSLTLIAQEKLIIPSLASSQISKLDEIKWHHMCESSGNVRLGARCYCWYDQD